MILMIIMMLLVILMLQRFKDIHKVWFVVTENKNNGNIQCTLYTSTIRKKGEKKKKYTSINGYQTGVFHLYNSYMCMG
jgi:hypothetical protein